VCLAEKRAGLLVPAGGWQKLLCWEQGPVLRLLMWLVLGSVPVAGWPALADGRGQSLHTEGKRLKVAPKDA
jgi:hypothetical protein